jgi:hypothetical protein
MPSLGIVPAINEVSNGALGLTMRVKVSRRQQFVFECRKEPSATALSQQSPRRLMLHCIPCVARTVRYSRLAY